MRVAHIITRMIIGGAQENTFYNCRDLVRNFGDEVLLLTGPSTGPEGALLEKAQAEFPVQIVPSLCREISPWKDWQSYRELRRRLAQFKPDVVHTHSAKAGILGRLAAFSLRVPAIVHTVHGAPFGNYESPLRRRFYEWCERYAARRCHALISVADAMTELMVTANIAPREKFVTIYSGMEVEPFLAADEHRAASRAKFGFQDADIVVAKIARLFALKGHDDLLLAAKRVIDSNPHVHFLLIGDGERRKELEQQTSNLGIEDHIHFVGLVPPTEIPALLGASDLLVHTSLREGLPRALPQALLAGKPVIAYDVDGAREAALPGRTGMLIPAGDIPALAAAIEKLAGDPVLRQQYGEAGRRLCRDRFRHEEMTAQIRRLYELLLP